mmetsp:Transcript_4447/g.14756  ORF Transcript_4447/g.14756 Transcript_4447/m.14756 type:complete len:437 (-) Transcript_4447:381-1691(-)
MTSTRFWASSYSRPMPWCRVCSRDSRSKGSDTNCRDDGGYAPVAMPPLRFPLSIRARAASHDAEYTTLGGAERLDDDGGGALWCLSCVDVRRAARVEVGVPAAGSSSATASSSVAFFFCWTFERSLDDAGRPAARPRRCCFRPPFAGWGDDDWGDDWDGKSLDRAMRVGRTRVQPHLTARKSRCRVKRKKETCRDPCCLGAVERTSTLPKFDETTATFWSSVGCQNNSWSGSVGASRPPFLGGGLSAAGSLRKIFSCRRSGAVVAAGASQPEDDCTQSISGGSKQNKTKDASARITVATTATSRTSRRDRRRATQATSHDPAFDASFCCCCEDDDDGEACWEAPFCGVVVDNVKDMACRFRGVVRDDGFFSGAGAAAAAAGAEAGFFFSWEESPGQETSSLAWSSRRLASMAAQGSASTVTVLFSRVADEDTWRRS